MRKFGHRPFLQFAQFLHCRRASACDVSMRALTAHVRSHMVGPLLKYRLLSAQWTYCGAQTLFRSNFFASIPSLFRSCPPIPPADLPLYVDVPFSKLLSRGVPNLVERAARVPSAGKDIEGAP